MNKRSGTTAHPSHVTTRTRWTSAAVGIVAAGAVAAGAVACSPIDYGCVRQGSHGPVVCHNTNHNPNAAGVIPQGRALHQPHKSPVVIVARGSSWT